MFFQIYRRKFRSQTSDNVNVDRWKSRGGESQRRERISKKNDKGTCCGKRSTMGPWGYHLISQLVGIGPPPPCPKPQRWVRTPVSTLSNSPRAALLRPVPQVREFEPGAVAWFLAKKNMFNSFRWHLDESMNNSELLRMIYCRWHNHHVRSIYLDE